MSKRWPVHPPRDGVDIAAPTNGQRTREGVRSQSRLAGCEGWRARLAHELSLQSLIDGRGQPGTRVCDRVNLIQRSRAEAAGTVGTAVTGLGGAWLRAPVMGGPSHTHSCPPAQEADGTALSEERGGHSGSAPLWGHPPSANLRRTSSGVTPGSPGPRSRAVHAGPAAGLQDWHVPGWPVTGGHTWTETRGLSRHLAQPTEERVALLPPPHPGAGAGAASSGLRTPGPRFPASRPAEALRSAQPRCGCSFPLKHFIPKEFSLLVCSVNSLYLKKNKNIYIYI